MSDDRSRLLLVDDQGSQFSLEITPALRSALRGDVSRLGQLEIQMDSALRPRDIQARIRAGETPEQVAQAAQTSVEKIMPFVGPVLAERQHVAERAQRASLRRAPGESAGSRTLGESVAAQLRGLNTDPASVEWDAWRREDGRWTLTAEFAAGARGGVAHFVYDAPGSYVVVDDDDARWLIGDTQDPSRSALPDPVPDDLQAARSRRLAAVPADELPLGTDAIELVSPAGAAPGGESPTDELPAVVEPRRDPVEPAAAHDRGGREGGAVPDDGAPRIRPDEQTAGQTGGQTGGQGDEQGDEAGHDDEMEHTAIRRPVQKKKGRASVPSWDEIMFGPSEG